MSVDLNLFYLLSELPVEIKARLAKNIFWKSYHTDMAVVSRGDPGDKVYFMGSGVAQVVNFSKIGRIVSFADIKTGGCFGELSVIDGEPRSATVIARSDCLIGSLAGSEFLSVVSQCEKTAIKTMKHLAQMVRYADKHIEDLSLMTTEQRICVELLSNVIIDPEDESALKIDPVRTQLELARITNTTQNSVARIFTKLYRKGLIERQGTSIRVLDRTGLENIIMV